MSDGSLLPVPVVLFFILAPQISFDSEDHTQKSSLCCTEHHMFPLENSAIWYNTGKQWLIVVRAAQGPQIHCVNVTAGGTDIAFILR
jgi:hypothetical protein